MTSPAFIPSPVYRVAIRLMICYYSQVFKIIPNYTVL